jgi:hypothetical protein
MILQFIFIKIYKVIIKKCLIKSKMHGMGSCNRTLMYLNEMLLTSIKNANMPI